MDGSVQQLALRSPYGDCGDVLNLGGLNYAYTLLLFECRED